MSNGSVTFSLTSGKEVGPFRGDLKQATPKDGYYLDVVKARGDYPTRLDFNKFKTVSAITFKPGVGKKITWTSWKYLHNGAWAVDRFMNLG